MTPQPASVRVIWFIPGRSQILRLPVAAIVQVGDVRTVVVASLQPPAEYIGGEPGAWLLRTELERIRSAGTVAEILQTTGPTIEVGEPEPLHHMVTADAPRWVRMFVLPAVRE